MRGSVVGFVLFSLLAFCPSYNESGRIKVKAPKYKPSAPKPSSNHRPYGWDSSGKQPTQSRPTGIEQPAHTGHVNTNSNAKPIGWNPPPQQNTNHGNQRPIGFDPPPRGTNTGGGTHYNTNQQPGTHYNTNQQPGTHYNTNQQPGTHYNTNQQPGGQWNPNQQHGGNWNPNQQHGGNWNPNQQHGGNWNPNQQHGGNWNPNQQPGGYWNSYQHGHTGQTFPHYGGGGGYGGYMNPGPASYVSRPSSSPFRYTAAAVGSGALGLFLGYGLAKMTTPSFGYGGGGFNRNYDHYEVHHYYHNKDGVPPTTYVPQTNIDTCAETSGAICSGNTQALCTRNGTIMCVTRAQYVVPCAHNSNLNCVNTTVPCVNTTINGCEGGNNATSILVPCISSANVYGNITYVNNTIVLNMNGTNSTTTTDGANSTTTVSPMTTTPAANSPPPQVFCVTVLAVPAASKPSEPQIIYEKHADFFNTFVKSIWGV